MIGCIMMMPYWRIWKDLLLVHLMVDHQILWRHIAVIRGVEYAVAVCRVNLIETVGAAMQIRVCCPSITCMI